MSKSWQWSTMRQALIFRPCGKQPNCYLLADAHQPRVLAASGTGRKVANLPWRLACNEKLLLRGCIAGLWNSPWNIIPVQLLDGVGAGLLGVATPGIVARLLAGGGHVNLGLGLVLTIQGIGAAFSNTYGGLFAQYLSYDAAFFSLAAAPCLGFLLFLTGTRFLPSLCNAMQNR